MSTLLTLSDFRSVSNHVEGMVVALQGNEHSPQLANVDKASVPDMADLRQGAVLSALKDALLSDPNYKGMEQTITTLLDDIRSEVAAAPQEKAVTGRDIQSILGTVDELTVAASLETRIMAEKGQHLPPGSASPSRQAQFETELHNAYIEQARITLREGKSLSEVNIEQLAHTIASQWAAKDALVESKADSLSPQSMQRLRKWHESCPRSLEQLAETVAQLTWIDKSHLLPEDKCALYNACFDNGNILERHDFSTLLAAAKDKAFPQVTQKWDKNNLSKESLQMLLDSEPLFARSPGLENRAVETLQRIDNAEVSESLKKSVRTEAFAAQLNEDHALGTLLTSKIKKHETLTFINLCSFMHKTAAAKGYTDASQRSISNNKGLLLEKLGETLLPLAENPEISLEAFCDISTKCSKLVNMLPAMNMRDMEMMFEVVRDPQTHLRDVVHDVVDRTLAIAAKYSKLNPDMTSPLDFRRYTNITHFRSSKREAYMPELGNLDNRVDLLLKMQTAGIAPDKAACLFRLLDDGYQRMLAGKIPSSQVIKNSIANMAKLEKAGLPDYVSYAVFCDTIRKEGAFSSASGTLKNSIAEAKKSYAKNPDPVRKLTNPWVADLGIGYAISPSEYAISQKE